MSFFSRGLVASFLIAIAIAIENADGSINLAHSHRDESAGNPYRVGYGRQLGPSNRKANGWQLLQQKL